MLASIATFTLTGIEAEPVSVEVHVTRGLPAFTIVGLPDTAVRESRERVRAALVNSGFEFPLRRITANLAPADLRKGGPGLDLALAAALLRASGQLECGLAGHAVAGELALDGTVRPIPGVLAMAERARSDRAAGIVVATDNAAEAALVPGLCVVAVGHLGELSALADGSRRPPPVEPLAWMPEPAAGPDLGDLRGQPVVRRALEVAAAGGHHLLMVGPPGSGKSMAARRLPSLLPELSDAERLEVMRIDGLAGRLGGTRRGGRPFRAPHHSVTRAGLVGGGVPPRPGELTLAHTGVLFCDELAEFERGALEAMREPLADGQVTISRARTAIRLPCRVQLVAAMNPCPCGRGTTDDACICTPEAARRYAARASGALLDRFDLRLSLGQPDAAALAGPPGEPSASVRARVVGARRRQDQRHPGRLNAWPALDAPTAADLTPAARETLVRCHRRLQISGRGHDRVLRVARTIADLARCDRIDHDHVAEALSLRHHEDVT